MKKIHLLLVLVMATTSLFAQKAASVELKNALDSVNYAYGINIGNTLKRVMDKDINVNLFLAGLNAVVNGTATKLTKEEANRRFNEYNTKTSMPRIAAAWKEENTKFLEENKKRKEVTTTASGLQYEVLTKGTGTVSPVASDKVEVHYHGTLIDGQIFDSSVDRKKTATFGLSQVISGWTEGLQYMKVGDKFRFFIPYNLAYGEQARGSIIKGFSTLIFDVELFKILPPEGTASPTASAPANTKDAAAICADNKALGNAFLMENKKRQGVTTTASGLQYEVIKRGTGTVSPKANDKVEVHYHGTLLDGYVFDSSVKRGETITFGLNQVIKGWTEGLQLMKEGDKFKFFIPAELAYGNSSPGAGIPPGATLTFEVELFKVNP
jgi:FKBP-type peptidyl-prolyl cis-trans isomerase